MNETSLYALLRPLRILVLGYGNVTQAFLPLLVSRSEWLGRELGIHPLISGIGTRSGGFFVHPTGITPEQLAQKTEARTWFASQSMQVRDATAFIQAGRSAGTSLLLELTTLQPRDGEPALTHIRTALQHGMDVITANKGPVAHAQNALQALARQRDVQFRFESTVMDGLPLINLAQFTLQAVEIRAFRALLNTTSGLVLSMLEQGFTLEQAILKAQQLGVAESDPWYDLDGWDAVMKTTILANNLLDAHITPAMVEREGIRDITSEDIFAAALSGAPLRLVSSASRVRGMVTASVRPQPIKADDILHVAKGTTSVISLDTEAMGTITLVEHEPLVLQTAYGVLSDLITIFRQKRST